MSASEPASDRTRVRRHSERGRYDEEVVHAILDEGYVGHVAFVDDGQPYCAPMLYARKDDILYLHGSPQSRLLTLAATGIPLCLTVTLIDGIVLARSWFHHSINYRSAVILGTARTVADRDEKLESMRILVDHIVPGRAADSRWASDGELKGTEMVAMSLTEASAKVRTGPPIDTKRDLEEPYWGGVLPLGTVAADPIPDEFNGQPLPEYIRSVVGGDPRAALRRAL